MALRIGKKVENGVGILTLEGSLTLGPSLHMLRAEAREILTPREVSSIVLDVQKITSIDSSGLSELMIVYSDASKQHRSMRLTGVSPNLHKMLKMTQLDGVLLRNGEKTGGASA